MQQHHSFLSVLVTVFLGLLVAAFVGFGLNAFYPAPQHPLYPETVKTIPTTGQVDRADTESARKIDEYEAARAQYEIDKAEHSKYASSVLLIAATLIFILSLTVLRDIPLIADGLLLGGVFTILYGVVTTFDALSARFQFGIVTASLIIAFLLIYFRFVRPQGAKGK